MKNKYDVVIVGAGPGGLKAAEVLAGSGRSVLVLEKTRVIGDKLCAGGITTNKHPKDLPFETIDAKFFDSFSFHFFGKTRRVSSDRPPIVVVERTRLGEYLAGRARSAGAEIETGREAEEITRKYVRTGNTKVYFEYLIGADGTESRVRKFLGLPTKKLLISIYYEVKRIYENVEMFFDPEVTGDGYGAIFPHHTYTELGVTLDITKDPNRDTKGILERWLEKEGLDWRGGVLKQALISYDFRGFRFGNIFLVGDAGGFTSGLTGGGISSAMFSGEEVAKKIINPRYACPKIRKILTVKFIHENIIKPLYRSRHPLLATLAYEITARTSKPIFYKLLQANPFFKRIRA